MANRTWLLVLVVFCVSRTVCAVGPATQSVPGDRPRLVVQITVDQLRGDMLPGNKGLLNFGGFQRLMAGVYYADAHYDHSTTFTAVGHATLATGGGPLEHGIAANDWIDLKTGVKTYCVEDHRYQTLGDHPKPDDGTSPHFLTSTTVGDELLAATAGKAKVFSVSIKDRAAILPGGHDGKAFWYDKTNGQFTSSTYYYTQLPQWAADWNARKPADQWSGKSWALLSAVNNYPFASEDDRPFERPYKNMGRTFPHPLGDAPSTDYYGGLRYAPTGDELTADFAEALIDGEQLGQDDVPDFLAISFSCTDYIGHSFGPDSLEAQDNLARLDNTLNGLVRFVNEKVGSEHVVFVLSADHGVDLISEGRRAAADKNHPTTQPSEMDDDDEATGRHYQAKFIEHVNTALKKKFGIDDAIVKDFWDPSLYFDQNVIGKHKLDEAAVERAVADEMMQVPGIARAITRTQLRAGQIPNDAVARAVQRSFHPTRSGQVMIVPAPFWYLYDDPEEFAAMHGTPYAYDTFVPIMIVTPSQRQRRVVHRRVSPRDIAPTLASLLGISPPSGSTGEVLVEVFGEDAGDRGPVQR